MKTDGESHETYSWISIALFISATAAKTILTKIAARETLSIEGGKDDDDEVSLPINDEDIYNIRRSRHRLSFDHSRSHLDYFQRCTKKQFHKSHRHFENKASYGVQSPQPSTQVMPAPHDVQEPDHRNSMKAYDRLQDLMNDNAKALQYQNDHLEVKYRTSSFTERILNRINHSFSSTSTHVSPEDEEEIHEASNCNSDTSRFAEWRSTYNSKIMPNRLIMVRHGQSEGNVNEAIYTEHPDNVISLTNLGWEQAKMAGKALRNQILNNGKEGSTVHFIVSPYVRTMETFHGLAAAWCDPDAEFGHITDEHKRKIMWYNRLAEMGITWHEDPRIREQDFGNYQNQETINKAKRERYKFGVFYYRFPNGESASDVYDRVSTFLDSLWRSFDANRSQNYVLGKFKKMC